MCLKVLVKKNESTSANKRVKAYHFNTMMKEHSVKDTLNLIRSVLLSENTFYIES